MIILGLNTFHAESSACIIVDGQIIAACEEERFSYIKNYAGFPKNAIEYCLKAANLKDINDVMLLIFFFRLCYFFIRLYFRMTDQKFVQIFDTGMP